MQEIIASAMNKMAMIGSDADKAQLRSTALGYTLDGWKWAQIGKLGSVGFLTGLPGGPIGLAMEGLDITYLLAASARAAYGIGHIKGRDVDYEADLPLILGIWAGAAEATSAIAAGKIGIKVAGKAALTIGATTAAKFGSKLLAKSAFKVGSKAYLQVIALASTKLAAKIAGKVSLKWIPVFGGIASAGINGWIMSGLMNAADDYYSNEYVVVSDDLAAASE